ncbi:hypothetical protein DITRI_Ditri11bG0089900 [Diplodiscus trichospermus]
MKRSRLNRSASFGNIRVLNPPPAAASAFRWNIVANPSVISAHAPPPKVWEKARVGILTVSAPEVAVGNDQQSHFLDKCFFCKKGLRQNDERFMYGDFRAFCSPECRSEQIIVDNQKDKVSKQSTGTKEECSRKSDLKYLSGAQLEKHAS